jgi:hypothetical protein
MSTPDFKLLAQATHYLGDPFDYFIRPFRKKGGRFSETSYPHKGAVSNLK